MRKFLLISGIIIATVAIIGGGAALVYWQHLKTTPQYSLASLVSAARDSDQAAIDELVDTDAVVNDFVPQVTGRAADLYGRGIPAAVLAQLTRVAAPLMPSIRARARAELPNLIRRETDRFGDVPFAAMVIGADRYLNIEVRGETATIRSKLPEHDFEVKMRQRGSKWQVIGVKDETLATRIAQAIGEQLLDAASGGDAESAGKTLGVRNIDGLLREVEKLLE